MWERRSACTWMQWPEVGTEVEMAEQPVLASTWVRVRRSPCVWAAAEHQLYSSGGSAWAGGGGGDGGRRWRWRWRAEVRVEVEMEVEGGGEGRWRWRAEAEVEVEGGGGGGRRSIGIQILKGGYSGQLSTFHLVGTEAPATYISEWRE
uniref:Uncharacterized protein n=1 Tax=Triticum urartu TaxID=4572 RepID=A0A8R7UKC7_TRIUA